jgi:hypothetical protein
MRVRYSFAAVVAGLAVAACETTASPPSQTPGVASPPATASAIPPVPAQPAPAPQSCLMTHVSGCNLGCAKVTVDASSLHEGMRVTAQTGPYAGKEMVVVKEADAAGRGIFALSDRDQC